MFKSIDVNRNTYTDAFLELLDIDYGEGELNFSEFLDVVVTYCMFERNEIFKCKRNLIAINYYSFYRYLMFIFLFYGSLLL